MPPTLKIPTSRIVGVLALAMVVLHAANLMAQVFAHAGPAPGFEAAWVELFRVNNEGLVPTWYSSLTLLACALLLFAHGWRVGKAGDRMRNRWYCLAAVFAFISLDEGTALHDGLSIFVAEYGTFEGVVASPWVIAAGALLVVLGVYMLPFLLALRPSTRNAFVAAGTLYVGGALGLEMIGGLEAMAASRVMPYEVLATWEELLEMAGILVFIRALLMHLEDAVQPALANRAADYFQSRLMPQPQQTLTGAQP